MDLNWNIPNAVMWEFDRIYINLSFVLVHWDIPNATQMRIELTQGSIESNEDTRWVFFEAAGSAGRGGIGVEC